MTIILERRRQAGGEIAFAALRAQAQVHAEEGTFRSHLGDQLEHSLREPREVFGVGGGPLRAAGGFTVAAVQKHQVDVRAVVQFLAAQLAEGKDGQAGRVAIAGRVGELRRTVSVLQLLLRDAQGALEQDVSEMGKLECRLSQRAEAQHIPQGDAQILATLEPRQNHCRGLLVRYHRKARELFVQIFRRLNAVQAVGRIVTPAGGTMQPGDQLRLLHQRLGKKSAVAEDYQQVVQRGRMLLQVSNRADERGA